LLKRIASPDSSLPVIAPKDEAVWRRLAFPPMLRMDRAPGIRPFGLHFRLQIDPFKWS
jgi:hypothetical protein